MLASIVERWYLCVAAISSELLLHLSTSKLSFTMDEKHDTVKFQHMMSCFLSGLAQKRRPLTAIFTKSSRSMPSSSCQTFYESDLKQTKQETEINHAG
ncbi:hypothetical protein QVD17_00077 [Tagetes erecta]|uniref:Uncharacterized protein n=1 Tax=Tagetes erecta TaxID=13708 RepID=A0AAD8L4C5_TARER|nr:hypothetical protein QVD17_00077 [Tagetes erecta]